MGATVVNRELTLRPAPAHEPPYDDERHPDSWLALAQPQLDLPPVPRGAAAPRAATPVKSDPGPPSPRASTRAPGPAPGPGLAASAPVARGSPTGRSAHRRSAPARSTPARAATARFLHTCLEVLNGYRPVTHIRALTNPLDAATVLPTVTDAVRRLERARLRAAPGERRLRPGPVRVCEPRPGVAEIAAVVGTGARSWALALRLERHRDRWLCTAAHLL